ncbi:MAG: hypothetical protein CL734_06395 [Chloroflexi bacterium]|nr:hypothetical protein [Chloroflexota bacterium]
MLESPDEELDFSGHVEIPRENASIWLPILRDLYRFESGRISGPGSEHRKLEDCIWTKEQALEAIPTASINANAFEYLIEYLLKNRQIMKFPKTNEVPTRYITRTGELVRTLGQTYEYWHRGRPGVTATRWLIEDKKIPERIIPAEEFRDQIVSKIEEWIPGPPGTNVKQAAWEVCSAVSKSLSKQYSIEVEEVFFSRFQLQCTLRVLESRYKTDDMDKNKAQVLTAGVGSGKTIGFSIASLIEARKSMLDALGSRDNQNLTTCLFIYPRTQLCRDQYKEISKFANELIDRNTGNRVELVPWLELYESYKKRGDHVTTGVASHYSEESTAKPVIITTFETLKRRMRRPEFMAKISNHLSTIVLDEIHLISGVGGGMTSYLLSRLTAASNRDIYWIGASATIARPDQHAARLFGLQTSEVGVVDPTDDELKQDGINHHIFIRPVPGMSTLGTLVNTTSKLIHQRRDNIPTEREKDNNSRSKTIGFADNLEMLGRWNDDLRENERTSPPRGGDKKFSHLEDSSSWNRFQREIPYALRFHKPLQRRLTSKGGDDADNPGDALVDLTGLFEFEKAAKICENCMAGNRTILGEVSSNELQELSKLVHRYPHIEDDKFKAFRIESEEFHLDENKTKVIGSHELCPMLRAGACSWFPRSDLESTTKLDGSRNNNPRYKFSSSAASSVFSAKSEKEPEEQSLASFIFTEKSTNVYDYGSEEQKVPVDIVLASPSLEVGVDLPKLTESVMHKAVRNIASYRQKAGRVGRESNLEVVNLSLISDTSVDLHYYRQPRKLVSDGRLEPVPLMEDNRAIKACSAYGSIWEWLALNSPLPEVIETNNGNLGDRLKVCRNELDSRREDVLNHIRKSTKGKLETDDNRREIARLAINQVLAEIDLLLLSTNTTYKVTPESNFEYTVIDLFGLIRNSSSGYGNRISLRKRLDNLQDSDIDDVDRLTKSISEEIRRIQPEKWLSHTPKLYYTIYDLNYSINNKTLSSEAGKNTISELKELGKEVDEFEDDTDILFLNLKLLIRILERMEDVEFDQRVESLIEGYKEIKPPTNAYLSGSMEELDLITHARKDSWFIRPATLFENPYSPEVDLVIQSVNENIFPTQLAQNQNKVKLHEALFGFQPGTWTHRIPFRRLKVRTGELISEDGRLVASIEKMSDGRVSSEFRPIGDGSLPPPPGTSDKVRVWAPTRLALIPAYDKYLTLDKSSERIVDNDEQLRGSRASLDGEIPEWDARQVKIPRTFSNRWTYSEPKSGEDIGVFTLRNHRYTEEIEIDEYAQQELNTEQINHPLKSNLFDSIKWHSELPLIEYSYSNSRSYSSAGDVELVYRDRHGRTVAFGEDFTTEGISFELKPDILKQICDDFEGKLIAGTKSSTPSLIKAFKAHVSTDIENGGNAINPYLIEDIISILLIHNRWEGEAISAELLVSWLENSKSLDERSNVKNLAKKFYKNKMKLTKTLSDDEEISDPDGENILENRAQKLVEGLMIVSDGIGNLKSGLPLWIHRTVLSTFGSVATTALQKFSGCDSSDVGYLIEPQSWDGESARVTIYDRAQFGNGSCGTAKEFMHIPHVLRYTRNSVRAKLPTTDFLSVLEEGLLQCMQHQSDMGALTILEQGEAGNIDFMPDLKNHSIEAHSVGKDVWRRIGVEGIKDAWALPIHRKLAAYYEEELSEDNDPLYGDDVVRATTSCWNGCPECVDDIQSTLGGFRGLDFIDKYILDSWFISGLNNSQDYGIYDFQDISEGTAEMHLGSLNRLHLDTPSRKIRSICLPWTMGFLTSRERELSPRLLMRHTDVSNMRIGLPTGTAHGIESHGFRRLLWFNLLMTGHLDSIGALSLEEKKIKFLYYDIRNISFQDIGLSPRMLDSMIEVSKGAVIEKLSDVIRWMLNRDFKIEICIDRMRATESGVYDFLTDLGNSENLTLRSMPREFSANMHKKILITPIAAMSGSANLTNYGADFSQENISHTMRSNRTQYDSLKGSARTTFSQAEIIDLDNISPARRSARTSGTGRLETQLTPIEKLAQEFSNGEMLGRERLNLEFKPAFLRTSRTIENGTPKDTVDVVFKEIASMINTDGGFVVVGAIDPQNNDNSDEFEIVGIDSEIENNQGADRFILKVTSLLGKAFTPSVASNLIKSEIQDVNGKNVLIFEVKPSRELAIKLNPVGKSLKAKQRNSGYNDGAIYQRVNDSAILVTPDELVMWHSLRFSSTN